MTITGDITTESGVGPVIDAISGPAYDHFTPKEYGIGLIGVCVVLMCTDPRLDLKRRVRLSKKDRTLYMDIMLNHGDMAATTASRRKQVIVERIGAEVPEILSKYTIACFDRDAFLTDLGKWLSSLARKKHG